MNSLDSCRDLSPPWTRGNEQNLCHSASGRWPIRQVRGLQDKLEQRRDGRMYSPRCAAVASCSARRACSPAGQSTEYASWGQATICQIRPIGHVRCAVYSVFSGVGRVSHACRQGRGDSSMHHQTFVSRPVAVQFT